MNINYHIVDTEGSVGSERFNRLVTDVVSEYGNCLKQFLLKINDLKKEQAQVIITIDSFKETK